MQHTFVEASVRLPAALIAPICCSPNSSISEKIYGSFSHCMQGVAQSFTSAGTNLVSQAKNIEVAGKISRTSKEIDKITIRVMDKAGILLGSIALSAITRQPGYVNIGMVHCMLQVNQH